MAAELNFGKQIRRPGGAIRRATRGEREMGSRAFIGLKEGRLIRRGDEEIKHGIDGFVGGFLDRRLKVSDVIADVSNFPFFLFSFSNF